MIDNGFMPEWIMLQKEIRAETQHMRERLEQARDRLSPPPLSADDAQQWSAAVDKLREDERKINIKIGNFSSPASCTQISYSQKVLTNHIFHA